MGHAELCDSVSLHCLDRLLMAFTGGGLVPGRSSPSLIDTFRCGTFVLLSVKEPEFKSEKLQTLDKFVQILNRFYARSLLSKSFTYKNTFFPTKIYSTTSISFNQIIKPVEFKTK